MEDSPEYDLSQFKSRPNPYHQRLKKQITLKISPDVLAYFKAMATEMDIPYQSVINLYLRDCMASQRQLEVTWKPKF